MTVRRIREFAVEDAQDGYASLTERFRELRQLHGVTATPESVSLLLQEAEANRRFGRVARASRLFNLALQLASRSGFRSGEAWALWGLGMLHRARGQYQQARRYFRSAHASAVRANDVRSTLWSRAELAETDRIAGDYRAAITAHRELRRSFQEPVTRGGCPGLPLELPRCFV